MSKTRLWVYYLIPPSIVLLVGLAFFLLDKNPIGETESSTTASSIVESGKDYYVMVSLVEVTALTPEGNTWDSVNNSAPDIYLEIFWRGLRVYRSTSKDDTLIAQWSNAELDLRAMALSGESASVDDAIRAARINVKEGEDIEIRVFDKDFIGNDDSAGTIRIPTTELKLGDTTHSNPEQGITRLILRVIPMSETPDLFK